MKILQINKFLYPKGGSETYMFELSKSLQSFGHTVEYWGMEDANNIVIDTYNCFVNNIDYVNLGAVQKLSSAFSTIYSKKSKKKIAIILDKFQPDIVHIHNFNFQLTPSILPEIKKRGIKVVYTAHDSQLVCPYHRLYNFQRDEICIKCIDGQFSHCIKDKCFDGSFMKSTIGAMESYLYHGLDYYNKYIDQVISPSLFLAKKLKHLYKKEIKVIPNFTELSLSDNDTKDDFVLYFGRISKEKGILDILPFFDKNKIHLKIIGNGPEVEHIIKSDYIEYLGPKYGNELFNYIQKSKFVIQPSKWYENCPMTVIESFGCATPVIASKHSGFMELIKNEVNGFLINFNCNNYESSLLKCIKNYDDRLSKNAKEDYMNFYTKKTHVPKIIDIYKKVIK